MQARKFGFSPTLALAMCIGLPFFAFNSRLSQAAAQTPSASGRYGFLVTGLITPALGSTENGNGIGLIGLMNLDESGNLTGSGTLALGSDRQRGAMTTLHQLNGSFSQNPDGTGGLTWSATRVTPGRDDFSGQAPKSMSAFPGAYTVNAGAFVSVGDGSGLMMLQTGRTDQSVQFGTAQRR
jgi:hypothetical protein